MLRAHDIHRQQADDPICAAEMDCPAFDLGWLLDHLDTYPLAPSVREELRMAGLINDRDDITT